MKEADQFLNGFWSDIDIDHFLSGFWSDIGFANDDFGQGEVLIV